MSHPCRIVAKVRAAAPALYYCDIWGPRGIEDSPANTYRPLRTLPLTVSDVSGELGLDGDVVGAPPAPATGKAVATASSRTSSAVRAYVGLN